MNEREPSNGSDDLDALLPSFFDEADDSLCQMEKLLLALDADAVDDEVLNSIFRCAHSVKGGASAFALADVAALSHCMESLLDRWRRHQEAPAPRGIELLLHCSDALREHMAQLRSGKRRGDATIAALLKSFSDSAGAAPPAAPEPAGDPCRVLELRLGPLLQPAQADGIVQMFEEMPELGRIDALDADPMQTGLRRFRLHTSCRDDELLALCGMHLPAAQLELRRASPQPAAAPSEQPRSPIAAAAAADPASLRVSVAKIDRLINLAAELLIAQTALTQAGRGQDSTRQAALSSALAELDRPMRELQHAVMAMRMVPIADAFSRFPRLLHDLSSRLGKQLRLHTEGGATELDKGMIEGLSDPLLHLLRNACDHGIESPDERIAHGKPPTGTITLSAAHQAGSMLIEVHDDGRGLSRQRLLDKARERGLPADATLSDAQVWELAFLPGLSTAESLSEVSGRGVGMDVVRQNIMALGGTVKIESAEGQGSRVSMRVPLTLAVIDAVSVAVAGERYVLPLTAVVEAVPSRLGRVQHSDHGLRRLQLRNRSMPLLDLHRLFELPDPADDECNMFIVVEADGLHAALGVKQLLGQHQAVVKNLDARLCEAGHASAATILGDGRVALILDTDSLVRQAWADDRRAVSAQGATC